MDSLIKSLIEDVTNNVTTEGEVKQIIFDLAHTPLREVNRFLHQNTLEHNSGTVRILNPDGAHNIAVGVDAPVNIEIVGHAGYYAAGMNQGANVTIFGNVGTGVAENMMSGRVQVKGFASVSAGASAQGGLLFVEGNAGLRCGISLKGGDIVVGGSVGSFAAFMAQAGRIVICGDAGDALGDSLYEAVIYVRGNIKSLGADAQIEPMTESDEQSITELLAQTNLAFDPKEFKRVASAKQLYHWNANANQEY
jgi:glutamate synthase domain-containing protein 3